MSFFSDCVSAPCQCQPTAACPANPCEDCFTAKDAVVTPLNGVGPCGKTGWISLAALNSLATCPGQKIFQLLPVTTDAFTRVWIENNDRLYWTTSIVDKAVPNCFFQVNYKMACKQRGLASIGCITIGIKDLCDCVFCETGKCDPCTGDCFAPPSDLGVTVLPASGDISVAIQRK
jgi:hypothetical protein